MIPGESYDKSSPDGSPAKDQAAPSDPLIAAIDSETLLKGGKELLIRHHGQIYRLRLTRNDKLILHK